MIADAAEISLLSNGGMRDGIAYIDAGPVERAVMRLLAERMDRRLMETHDG